MAAFLLVLVSLGGLVGALLWQTRDQTLKEHARAMAAGNRTAAVSVGRTFGALDLTARIIIGEFKEGTVDRERVARQFANQLNNPPHDLLDIMSTAVLDETGKVLHTDNPQAMGLDLSHRAYFQYHAGRNGMDRYIGEPVRSVLPPYQGIVPISWPLRRNDGSFAGIALVVTSWMAYRELLAPLVPEGAEHLYLVDPKGTLYATDSGYWPNGQAEPQRSPVLDVLPWPLEPVASLEVVDPLGERRVASVARVNTSGLLMISSTKLSLVLATWYRQVYLASALIVLLSILVGLFAAHLRRKDLALREAVAQAQSARLLAEAGERAKSRFLATMSHEIRTPMTAVLGMVELMAEERLEPRLHGYVSAIRRSGEQLLAIINDVLDFMKLGTDSLTLAEVDFAPAAQVEEVLSVMRPQVVSRGLALHVEIGRLAGLALRGDPRRFKQVLFNLIGNAVKFTPTGSITLRARHERGADGRVVLHVEVEDTGIGFDENGAAELFAPFVQADVPSGVVGGTGLGLTISKSLVSAMGGAIGCHSAPGRGSTFWIEIPFEAGSRKVASLAAVNQTASGRRLFILVAEDAPLNQELIAELLERQGHEVVMTANGADLLDRAARQTFDLIIMDISMPVMDGETAIRQLRQEAGLNQHTPAIALTANVIESDQRRYLAAGFDTCLSKPIERQAFLEALDKLPAPPTSDEAAANAPIDWRFLERTTEGMAVDRVMNWLMRVMNDAEETLERLSEPDVGPEEARRWGHRLKGQARNFGLSAIGSAAEAIERAAQTDNARPPLADLEDAVAQTRRSLDEHPLVQGPAEHPRHARTR